MVKEAAAETEKKKMSETVSDNAEKENEGSHRERVFARVRGVEREE